MSVNITLQAAAANAYWFNGNDSLGSITGGWDRNIAPGNPPATFTFTGTTFTLGSGGNAVACKFDTTDGNLNWDYGSCIVI